MPLPTDSIEHRLTLSASLTPAGKFEILAITAGVGNGWTFPPAALQQSLRLWDKVECFVDHDFFGHSLKDLAGILHAPTWDDARQGIRAQLRAAGPSGPLLDALGREMLADPELVEGPKPDVGFSADLLFTAQGKTVETILRVLSVDLVFDPARGGAFLRALNSARPASGSRLPWPKEETMADTATPPTGAPPANPLQPVATGFDAADKVRAQMCSYMLDAGLAASRLPAPMQAHLRVQFAGPDGKSVRVFEPGELQAAVDSARQLVSDLTASAIVQGPGLHAMFNEADQLQAAVDDLFGAPRDKALQAVHVARLQGIRELYHLLTGDFDLHGGYHPERVGLATTSDFSGLVKNALNKVVVNKWDELGRAGYDWWKDIVTVEHFNSLNTITGTLVGAVGALPTVAEGGEYTELAVGDSPETASFTKYGGYIPLTLELIDRDESRKLVAYARELANAGLRKLSALVAAIFTDNSGVGPTLADTGALFNATAVTSAGGHANLLTTALSASQWDTVSKAIYDQPMLIKNATGAYGTGAKMAVNPRFCLVPRALQYTARQIFLNDWDITSNVHAANLWKGMGVPVTVPEWTDANDWAAVCDPAVAPAIYVGERFGLVPEIFIAGDSLSPAVFMNDEHRIKARMFCAVWVNDFRPLHKENV
jgi:hypothetical protein